jgi:hypothetical protein
MDPSIEKESMLPYERLRDILYYDPWTGRFIYIKRVSKRMHPGMRAGHTDTPNSKAGSPDLPGYRAIIIDGRKYKEHRLAWFYVHKVWPPNEIDHINGLRDDNRIANLRTATAGQNLHNKRLYKNSTTGVTGVSKRGNRFDAYFFQDRKMTKIGSFHTLEEAAAARAAAIAYRGEFRPLAERARPIARNP